MKMSHKHITLVAALLLVGCSEGVPKEEGSSTEPVATTDAEAFAPITFPQVDDNLKHDTLLIQVTFDMGDGSFLIVASHYEETFDGLRLYHYRPKADSSAEMLHVSAPAYDSWTMFPTFFRDPHNDKAFILLTNLGERESWGQKVFRLDHAGFHPLGFLDVAAIDPQGEAGTDRLISAAKSARVEPEGNGLLFRFNAESVRLFDDQQGLLNVDLKGDAVMYRWSPEEGMVLWVNDIAHLPEDGGA